MRLWSIGSTGGNDRGADEFVGKAAYRTSAMRGLLS